MRRSIQFPGFKENEWRHEVIRSTFTLPNGETDEYEGEVLVSKSGHQGRLLTGEVKSSTLRPASLSIPVSVSEPVRLVISCNNNQVWSGVLEGRQPNPLLYSLVVDITKEKESVNTSEINFRFIFTETPGTVCIPLQHAQYGKPALIERRQLSYSWLSACFHILAWGTLLNTLVVALSASRLFADPRIAASTALISSIAGYFGLRGTSILKVKDRIRSLYGAVRGPKGRVVMSALAIALLISSTASGMCLYGAWRRVDYTKHITDYLNMKAPDPMLLREAFIREPWRPEAQILIEQTAYVLRADRESLRAYIRKFIDDPAVQNAVDRAGVSAPYYLKRESPTTSDPTLWFAGILPEGDDETEWQRYDSALARLKGREGCASELQYLVLSIPRNTDEAAMRTGLKALQALEEKCERSDVSSHGIQLALDLLGQDQIRESNQAAAVNTFQKLLRIRQRAIRTAGLPWRVPEKLVLFHMFRSIFDHTTPKDDPIHSRADVYLDYENFRPKFRREIYDTDANAKFRTLKGWEEGTIEDENFREKGILEMLNDGWRL